MSVSSATCSATCIDQLITENNASFDLHWQENSLNRQKVSKRYKHNSLQNFLARIMSL